MTAMLMSKASRFCWRSTAKPNASISSSEISSASAGIIVAQNPLYTALEQTPSQQRFETENGDIILPIMSFQATDGRYCRKFQINTERKVSVGVACKQAGYWNTEILLAADSRSADKQARLWL